jgi:hypothetical protein
MPRIPLEPIVTAISDLPSPLKSPTDIEVTLFPAMPSSKILSENDPSPFPREIPTLPPIFP